MLQYIRERFTGGFAIAILVLIGIPFVFFGLNYDFTGSGYAAKIDGVEIDTAVFEQEYRNALQRDPNLAQAAAGFRQQIRRAVLDSLVRQQLLENYLDDAGYRITDKQLTDVIQRIPAFQVDGKFDMATYQQVLAQQGYEPRRFEALQREQMRLEQLQTAIAGSAIVTPAEYRRYLNLVAEQRSVQLAAFTEDSVIDEVEVSDEMVQEFYDNNLDSYLVPESADVAYVEISREEAAADIEVSEDQLATYYEEQKYRYQQDEQRQARHILLLTDEDEDAAEALANELKARIDSGESFAELAEEYSADTESAAAGGDLGSRTRSQLPGELGTAIFTMNEGDVIGPIRTDFGLHIVQLDRVLEQGPLPMEQVRGELLRELRDLEAEAVYQDLERQLSDALFDAADLEAVAVAVDREIQTASGITRSGGEPFGSNQAAIDAIFDERVLTGGELSELTELDTDTAAVFAVTRYNEATHRPLEEVREDVVEAVRAREADKILQGRAEEMLQAVEAGADFAEAAQTHAAELSEPMLLSRQSTEVDRAVVSDVFSAPKPSEDEPVTGRVANIDGGYTVYSLRNVIPGRPESIPLAERDAGKQQLAQQSGLGDLRAFVESLYQEADVVINQDVLAAEDLLQ